jgi:glycosyltransferase involved in cell wall biosynthesis
MSRPSLRVAIDAHTIGRKATGNETYVRGLLSGLLARGDIEPLALLDKAALAPEWLSGHSAELRSRNPVTRLLIDLSASAGRWSAELLHVQYVRPPCSDVPVVTTIHDISFEHFPRFFTSRTRARMRLMIPWSARRSRVVLTGSEHARQDLIETYGLPPDRVRVTPYAADASFTRLAQEETARRLARLGLKPGYVLCVGNLQPRKNLARLLEAYANLHPSIQPPLVVVGQPAWLYEDVYAAVAARGISRSVHFTGFVRLDELVALYNGAAVFAYPSLYEGFGLPVLEALACGVPTLTSDSSALPEVAGEAAILVDPESTEAINHGLARLLSDSALRGRLAVAGPEHASSFSWARCAAETAAAYQRALR